MMPHTKYTRAVVEAPSRFLVGVLAAPQPTVYAAHLCRDSTRRDRLGLFDDLRRQDRPVDTREQDVRTFADF